MTQDPFSSNAADAFLSGGAPAAKWPKVGSTFEGTVLSYEMAQQVDYNTGEPAVWADGKPKMQLIMTVQGEPTGITWEGLTYDEVKLTDDDGIRRVFIKSGLQQAFKMGLTKAKARLEEGAYVHITREQNGPKTDPKFAAPHRYTVVWTPKAQNTKAGQDFLDSADENPFA